MYIRCLITLFQGHSVDYSVTETTDLIIRGPAEFNAKSKHKLQIFTGKSPYL